MSFDKSVYAVMSICAAACRYLYAWPLNTDFLPFFSDCSFAGGCNVLELYPPLLIVVYDAWFGVSAVMNAFVDWAFVAPRPSNFDRKVTVD